MATEIAEVALCWKKGKEGETTHMNIILPETLLDWLEAKASIENRTPEDYVLGLVGEDRRKTSDPDYILRRMIGAKDNEAVAPERLAAACAQLQAKLMAGLQSGPPIPIDDAFWQERRRKLAERFGPLPDGDDAE